MIVRYERDLVVLELQMKCLNGFEESREPFAKIRNMKSDQCTLVKQNAHSLKKAIDVY
jgi:hypothetical protein